MLPAGFSGYPEQPGETTGPLADRLLEVLLLGNRHGNLAAWLSPIQDPAVLTHLEQRAEALSLPRAELAAMVIGTLPSAGAVAERWLWAQRDSVLEAAVRRIRSDGGLGCFVHFAAADDGPRLHELARRRLQRGGVFEGRMAVALGSLGGRFTELVPASWVTLPAAAKLHWGVQFEKAVAPSGGFSREIRETIRDARGRDTGDRGA